MILEPSELQSGTVIKLKTVMEKRLQAFRETNDKTSLSELETARLRGMITEVKYLISLLNTGQ